jgi:glutamyl-tRNA synthetase
MASVVTRFAPSPTGYLHVGGARTALFAWLYARRHGGKFFLRIEDTDKERSTDENTRLIFEGMRWLGLDWDNKDTPFLQSARTAIYQEHVQRLLAAGKAYRCYCTKEELEAKRKAAEAAKTSYRYDRTCRRPTKPGVGPYVIRAAFEETGETVVHDLVKGDVVVNNAELSDEIILRSDGGPMYNLCVVIDDHEMGVTHVLRGDDHLNNTPKQIQLYHAFGYEPPAFGHLPLINDPSGKKLSKRSNTVRAEVHYYKEAGYLPEAMVNFLARIGWSHGDQEIFSVDQLVEIFDIPQIGKSSGKFDIKKLDSINQHWIKQKPLADLVAALKPFADARGWKLPEGKTLEGMIAATRDRAVTLPQMLDAVAFLFVEEPAWDAKAVDKFVKGKGETLGDLAAVIAKAEPFDNATVEAALKGYGETKGMKFGDVASPLRVALTGGSVSPPIHDVITLLGKDRVAKRLSLAQAKA